MELEELRYDIMMEQKKGLPFMMSAVLIWLMIAVVASLDIPLGLKNTIIFCCSCPLMPLAYGFGKLIKVGIFSKKNPLSNLGLLFTLNQMLYLLIVMWTYSSHPEKMVMVYAMVFGAHLLPFSWIYCSKSYAFFSIVDTIVALIVGCYLNAVAVAMVLVVMEALLVVSLVLELKRQAE